MTDTERLLHELVALPSVNPALLSAPNPRAGEQRVAEFLAATAAKAGLDVELRPVFPSAKEQSDRVFTPTRAKEKRSGRSPRSNLIARLIPSGRIQQRILLAPHLDTVDAEPGQFVPRRKGGRLLGRGACDAKGSVATMMRALCEMARTPRRPATTEIVFAGLVDEEDSQAGSRALAASGFKADLAIIGEPTRLQVVTAHKGTIWLRLETRGRSAHGSRPELGRNAVHAMARVVDVLETEYVAQLARRRHPLLGCATSNVGVISGGTQPNTVPDSCFIQVDRRTLPGETQAGVRREILTLLRQRKLRATLVDDQHAPCLPLETDADLPLVARFLRSVRQRRPAGVRFFCDASVLAAAGIPSVVFGPGDIAQAHTADEWISLSAVERAKAMLLRFLESLP
jgi:acetylornithine deacetylase/succinyl-diaminopimelate desuccinylase-like protein